VIAVKKNFILFVVGGGIMVKKRACTSTVDSFRRSDDGHFVRLRMN
jgi:hypothetical protein